MNIIAKTQIRFCLFIWFGFLTKQKRDRKWGDTAPFKPVKKIWSLEVFIGAYTYILELICICTNIYKWFNFHSEAPETESFQYHLFFFPNKTFRSLKIILSGDWLTDGSAPLQQKMERLVAEDRRKWPSEHDCSQEETVCGIARFFALHYYSQKNSFLNTFIIQKWDVSPHLRFESRHPAKYCT